MSEKYQESKPEIESQNVERLFKASRTDRPAAPDTYKNQLLAKLLNQYPATQTVRVSRLPIAVLLVALIAVLAAGLFWTPGGLQTATAAQLLNQANQAFLAQAEQTGMIYDRLSLSVHTGILELEGAAVELWQTPDGGRFRYQVTDRDGTILYFSESDGSQFWRSFHSQPVGSQPVQKVYSMTREQYLESGTLSQQMESTWAFANRDLSIAWGDLDRVLVQNQGACIDLFCLLGVPAKDWQCTTESCSFSWQGEVALVLTQMPDEIREGKTVHVLEFTSPHSQFIRTIKLDAQTLALKEISDRDGSVLIDLLVHDERTALETYDPTFFATPPAGVEVAAWHGQPAAGDSDRVWLVSVSPQPGMELTGNVTFDVRLGYELVSSPEAQIKVELWPVTEMPGFGIEGSEFLPVKSGLGEVTLQFTASTETLTAGWWTLQAGLSTFTGATTLDYLVFERFEDQQWCVRCQAVPSP